MSVSVKSWYSWSKEILCSNILEKNGTKTYSYRTGTDGLVTDVKINLMERTFTQPAEWQLMRIMRM